MTWWRRVRSEDGVSGVIVAITMVALIAILGLSVDGGAFLLKRRQMVNAADAAALAYGISCLQGAGDPTATTQADSIATSNVAGATRTAKSFGCSSGKVTVTYSGSQPRYFLPIVGVSSTGTVTATSSAAWGGAGGAITPPIEVTLGGIQNCNFPGFPGPPPPGPEPQCVLTFPNGGGGQWGGVNTTNIPADPAVCRYSTQSNQLGWNVCGPGNSSQDARPNCGGMSASEANQAMNGSVLVTLNPAGTTWVCADNGQTDSIWNQFNDGSHLGKVFCFAMTDQTKVYLDKGKPKAYDVIAFVPLRVVTYSKQGSNLFLTVSWPGPQPCGTSSGGSSGYGAYEIGLSG